MGKYPTDLFEFLLWKSFWKLSALHRGSKNKLIPLMKLLLCHDEVIEKLLVFIEQLYELRNAL